MLAPFALIGLYHEVDSLTRNGYIVELNEETWQLGPQFSSAVEPLPTLLKEDVEQIASTYGALPLSELIDHVYEKYPWFTINSTSRSKRQLERPQASPAVYTVGKHGNGLTTARLANNPQGLAFAEFEVDTVYGFDFTPAGFEVRSQVFDF